MSFPLRFVRDEKPHTASPESFTLGKIVCVGRNYAEHARELNNPVPAAPLLFIKPESAASDLDSKFKIPETDCHYEAELALLIQSEIKSVSDNEAMKAIGGVGIALDLTRRSLQSELKAKGHPWEIAKGFDGSCPLTPFVPIDKAGKVSELTYTLAINGALRQQGQVKDMITPIPALLAYISQYFTLKPGDVVLTGTPEGVGILKPGDRVDVEIAGLSRFSGEAY